MCYGSRKSVKRTRNVPQIVEREIIGHVEVGWPPSSLGEKVQQAGDGIKEGIAGDGTVAAIDGPAPCVAGPDFKTMAHFLVDLGFHSMEEGIITPLQCIHLSNIRTPRTIDGVSGSRDSRPAGYSRRSWTRE